jgi:hypothetical protein
LRADFAMSWFLKAALIAWTIGLLPMTMAAYLNAANWGLPSGYRVPAVLLAWVIGQFGLMVGLAVSIRHR